MYSEKEKNDIVKPIDHSFHSKSKKVQGNDRNVYSVRV